MPASCGIILKNKYPFVNFYGVDKERQSHSFKSKSGRIFTRKTHPFKLKPKISDLTIPDDLINRFADDISNLLGDQILAEAGKQFQPKENFQIRS